MTRTVLITGGTYGIGRAIAAKFAADHNVLRSYQKTKPSDDLEDQSNVLSYSCDLLQDGSAENLVARAMDHFGRIDVIVNNAGLVRSTPIESFDAEAHRQVFELNAIAPQALLTAALPHLSAGAAIVNISSMNADLPPRGAATYGASKAALNLWTKAMAKELGPQGIHVAHVIIDGAIDTAFVKERFPERYKLLEQDGLLQPDDIAENYWNLHSQNRTAWTFEMDLRPWMEKMA